MIECENCGGQWTIQEIEARNWHCPECSEKIAD